MILNVLSVLILSAAAALPQQSPSRQPSSDQYQSAVVLEVKEHPGGAIPATEKNPPITQYDVSVQVKDTIYDVLVTPLPGTTGFQNMAGRDILVLVKDNSITFNDIMGRTMTAPIVNRHPAPPKPKGKQ